MAREVEVKVNKGFKHQGYPIVPKVKVREWSIGFRS